MAHDAGHEPFRQAAAAVALEDEDVGDVREGGAVLDDTGEADLRGAVVHTEAE